MFFSLPRIQRAENVFFTVCNENGTKKKVFIPSSRLTHGEKNHPCLFCSFRLVLEHNIVYSSHNILNNVKIYVRPAGGIFLVNLAFYLLVEKLIFKISTILQTRPDVTLWVHYYILPIRNIHQGYYGCGPPPILDMPSSKIALNTFSSSNCKIPPFFSIFLFFFLFFSHYCSMISNGYFKRSRNFDFSTLGGPRIPPFTLPKT